MQGLIDAEGVRRFGYATGMGKAGAAVIRTNLTGDPYVTDGLRRVVFLSPDPVPLTDMVCLEWENPPQRTPPR